MTRTDALAVLGLRADMDLTADVVRRAYLRRLAEHPPERDAVGFRRIRQAFELLRTDDDHDLPEDDADHHMSAAADRAPAAEPPTLDALVERLLRHLEANHVDDAMLDHARHGELAHAGADVAAHATLQYMAIRELLEVRERLPPTSVPAVAASIRAFDFTSELSPLQAYLRAHRSDGLKLLEVLRSHDGFFAAMLGAQRGWRHGLEWAADHAQYIGLLMIAISLLILWLVGA